MAIAYSNTHSECLFNTSRVLSASLGSEGKMLPDRHHPDFPEPPGDTEEPGTCSTWENASPLWQQGGL